MDDARVGGICLVDQGDVHHRLVYLEPGIPDLRRELVRVQQGQPRTRLVARVLRRVVLEREERHGDVRDGEEERGENLRHRIRLSHPPAGLAEQERRVQRLQRELLHRPRLLLGIAVAHDDGREHPGTLLEEEPLEVRRRVAGDVVRIPQEVAQGVARGARVGVRRDQLVHVPTHVGHGGCFRVALLCAMARDGGVGIGDPVC